MMSTGSAWRRSWSSLACAATASQRSKQLLSLRHHPVPGPQAEASIGPRATFFECVCATIPQQKQVPLVIRPLLAFGVQPVAQAWAESRQPTASAAHRAARMGIARVASPCECIHCTMYPTGVSFPVTLNSFQLLEP